MAMQVCGGAVKRPVVGIYRSVWQNDEALTSAESRGCVAKVLAEIFKSHFWEIKARFGEARDRLALTRWLRPGWDTYGGEPPNETARMLAAKVLTALEYEALPPSRLLPSAEGGIALAFAQGDGRAEIEIYNTGEIAAVAYSGDDEPAAWDLDATDAAIRSTIEQIRVHLSA
jgi:hypothetical protein